LKRWPVKAEVCLETGKTASRRKTKRSYNSETARTWRKIRTGNEIGQESRVFPQPLQSCPYTKPEFLDRLFDLHSPTRAPFVKMTGSRIPATMGLFHPIDRQKTPSECVHVFPCGISLWFAIAGGWHGNLLLRLRLFEVSHLAFSVVGPFPVDSYALACALLELRRTYLFAGFGIPQAAPHAQSTPQRASAAQRNVTSVSVPLSCARCQHWRLNAGASRIPERCFPAGAFIASPTSRRNAIGS
jgi:hypothetical protein